MNDYIHTLSDSVEAFEFRNKKKAGKIIILAIVLRVKIKTSTVGYRHFMNIFTGQTRSRKLLQLQVRV